MMRYGRYIRGWKFDWDKAAREAAKLEAAGRHEAAAHFADPGCVSCPACGESHWREFEVFACARCGAEVVIGQETYTNTFANGKTFTGRREKVTAGPPENPAAVPPRLFAGMRVRWNPVQTMKRGRPNGGGWLAGRIPIGMTGTVYPLGHDGFHVVWDRLSPRTDPKTGMSFRWGIGGGAGEFLEPDFEVLPSSLPPLPAGTEPG